MRASFIMWNMQRRPSPRLADEVADRAARAVARRTGNLPSPKFSSVFGMPR